MDSAASSSNQVSQNVMTILFAIVHLSETCKSKKPQPIAPPSTIAPDGHPLDWTNAVQQEILTDTGATNPISLKCLSQQYINNIRLASRSLTLILEKFKEQTLRGSPDRSQTTMLGLATSQKKISELFKIATTIFPPDLDNTVNAMAQTHATDQNWEEIEFSDNDSKIQQVGLEHLFSKEYYAKQPMFKSKVNLTWSTLPMDLTNRYVGCDQAPTTVL